MSSGVPLSESETDTSETSGRQSDLLSVDADASIKGKLEEFSARLNELQLNENTSEDEIKLPVLVAQGSSAEATASSSESSSRYKVSSQEQLASDKTDRLWHSVKKVKIRLQPIGSVPQIRPRVCQISSDQRFATLTKFLCKRLNRTSIHCYVNNAFAPSLDQNIGALWTQFKVNDELIVSYCETVAFG